MRKAIFVILLFAAGCTSPTTKVAMRAMERGLAQTDSVVLDLSTLAKQSAVDRAGEQVRAAVVDGDQAAGALAVEQLATDLDKVRYLEGQWLRARWGLLGLVDMYIHQQQGIASLWLRDWEAARLATQPSQ